MKRRNNKKRTTYTILLIVIAVLVVGYATLSQVLNIFGGLSIIGGNNWGIRWDNVVINSDSTAVPVTPPVISSGGSSANNTVNFVVNLNKPGDFYEFNVDAVNYGSIDAMISNIEYDKLDEYDNPVDVDFLNCTVTYSNDIQLSSGHLLAAGQTATYKVRVEFNSDISEEELPSGEEAYRFEFTVTYVQADDAAYIPGDSSLPEIPNAIDYGYEINDGTWYRLNTNQVFVEDEAYYLGEVFSDRTNIPTTTGFDFAFKHVVDDGLVSNVGITFRYNTVYSDFTWSENCYDGTARNTLNNIFQGQCSQESDVYTCDDGESMYVQLYDDSSLIASNGVYTCSISYDGESYCYGG